MKKQFILPLIFCLFYSLPAIAQTQMTTGWLVEDHKQWGIEFSPIYPLVAQAGQIKLTKHLWRKNALTGEFILGTLFVPFREDEEAKAFTEINVILGYRQFFWRGAHIEVSLPIGYARQHSAVDDQIRHAFVVNSDALLGYRLDYVAQNFTWYLNPQVGMGYIAYISDPWPENNAFEYRVPFFSANLTLGLRW